MIFANQDFQKKGIAIFLLGEKMPNHSKHQMQLTSLLQYFPTYNEQEFNQKFRQEVKRNIIRLLQERGNLTDREMSSILGYVDPNKIRPRRNELSNAEYHKRTKIKIRDAILIEDEKRMCNVSGKLSIAWKLNNESLNAYIKN